ncbi:MAG TPA: sigma-70 family RNA polymerase sigma factor [Acidimicrobiales bacterium]|nr:sigma-70 family RNA polymerase sigma factor [Acidimicrobiales bacterium]
MTASVGGPDEELLVAARSDSTCFALFYDRHRPQVLGFFHRRTSCPHTSAELTAETFARAYAARGRFDPALGSGAGWLMGVAANLFRAWVRAGVASAEVGRRWGSAAPRHSEDDLERIDARVDRERLGLRLDAALAGLSSAVRDAVLLRVGLDLPYAEVAARLGCTEGAARVRVSRGLDRLHQRLAQPR